MPQKASNNRKGIGFFDGLIPSGTVDFNCHIRSRNGVQYSKCFFCQIDGRVEFEFFRQIG
jgi:hypothetical protein